MNWLKKFGSLCLAVVLSVCLVAQVGSALADDKKVTSVEVETMPNKTVYVIGEEFSAEGGTLSKPTMKTANTKNVTATVGKKRVVFKIEVVAGMCVVTFDLNYDGAPAASTQEVSKGGTASEPAAPARDGYEFVAWYADADYTHTYDFAAPVTGDTTVYAFWKKVGADFVTVTFDYDYYGVLLNQYSYPVEVGTQPTPSAWAMPSTSGWTKTAATSTSPSRLWLTPPSRRRGTKPCPVRTPMFLRRRIPT